MENINHLRPFTRFCMTIGELPSSYTVSLTYEEQLLWLCNYIEKTVIPTVNNNADAVTELQNLYKELKSYVDNYFKNLDVQEEINNKLDEMADSGTLEEIITAYLNVKGILAFNTVNDMKNATNLIEGSFAKTYGLNTYNDGYGEFYKIRKLVNTDVVDGVNIIAMTNDNTLVAEKMENAIINNIETNIENIKTNIENINNTINPIGLYKNKNLVVFGDSFTDPINNNSLNGYWVKRVAISTGMKAFNFAKRGSKFNESTQFLSYASKSCYK